jgi:cell division protein FtsZ
MLNAGAAVMGSSETRGDNRAIKSAQQALASPLLDNKDIMGAKKILLSIISGEEAELQMDELTTITEYIQQQAGDEAEVIFGHGVDSALGDRIRVTVIATGFLSEGRTIGKKEEKKVHELDRLQMPLFGSVDNSVNQRNQELELKIINEDKPLLKSEQVVATKPEEPKKLSTNASLFEEEAFASRTVEFTITNPEETTSFAEEPFEDEDSLFREEEDDDFDLGKGVSEDQVINEDGLMEYRKTKERLEQQARERREKLKKGKTQEMTKDEFKQKWEAPAYLRRGVKMDNVPHSSESHISRYSLNDDNSLLGNNKFLHDNVD